MPKPHEPLPPRGRLGGRSHKRLGAVLVLAGLSMTGLMAADSCSLKQVRRRRTRGLR
jgi:hypothetical protein